MTRYLIALTAAATATFTLFSATTMPAQAQTQHHAPRIISQTADGQPIMLGTLKVTATALRD